MDRIWSGHRRAPNRGTVGLFGRVRGGILAQARRAYGDAQVASARFGRVRGTAYVVLDLAREPDGAEGPAADAFMARTARLYEALRDGRAGEAALLAGRDDDDGDYDDDDGCDDDYDGHGYRQKKKKKMTKMTKTMLMTYGGGGGYGGGEDARTEDDGTSGRCRPLPARLIERDGLRGLRLVDLFEFQVNHPISGRLLVGPIEKQKRFMGL